MADMVRKHISVPREIAEEFEKLVGERNQSAEIVALMEARIRRERAKRFFSEHAGFVNAEDHPEWATPEGVNEWVRRIRREDWLPSRDAEVAQVRWLSLSIPPSTSSGGVASPLFPNGSMPMRPTDW